MSAIDEYVKGQIVVITFELTSTATTLAADITAAATTVTLDKPTGPSVGAFTLRIDSEQMTVTAGNGTTTLTVTRGANGTAAVAHSKGAKAAGLIDDASEGITVYRQDGTVATNAAPTHPSLATYKTQVTTDQAGYWTAVSKSTGAAAGAGLYRFFVIPTPG